MIQKTTTLLFFLLIISSQIFSQGIWSMKANLGPNTTYGRSKGVSFEVNGIGYMGTGYNGTARVDLWAYDPTTNVWTQKANFGGSSRYGAFGFAVNGNGYIGTGFSSPSYLKDVWKYDVAGNSWSQVADFGGSNRMDVASFVIGNRAYVGTGYAGGSVVKDFWQYNPVSNSWLQKANYGGASRSSATGFAVNGKGYICLGASTSTYFNDIYQYDTTANTWTAKANFPGAAREGASAFVISNFGYVGTGGSNSLVTLYNDFYKYDPAGNTWSLIPNFTGSLRSHACSFSIGKSGYVGTGYTGGQVNSFYQYNSCSLTNTITATSVSCNGGSNASINLTVAGANNPVSYAWSNAATTQDLSGLAAGGYTVLITDANGCTASDSIFVAEPFVIFDSIIPNNILCKGDSTGLIYFAVFGGTTPYTYAWSNTETTQNISGLIAGNYSVLITDANGCTNSNSTTITEPGTAITYSISSTPANCSTCSDGTASIVVSGGNQPYSYLWSPTSYTTATITGLLPGQYTVCVTDSNYCVKCDTISIGFNNSVFEYDAPSISIFPNPSNGEFYISGIKTKTELSIYNCLGVKVYQTSINRKREKVSIETLSEGVYFLYLKTEDKIITKKITFLK